MTCPTSPYFHPSCPLKVKTHAEGYSFGISPKKDREELLAFFSMTPTTTVCAQRLKEQRIRTMMIVDVHPCVSHS